MTDFESYLLVGYLVAAYSTMYAVCKLMPRAENDCKTIFLIWLLAPIAYPVFFCYEAGVVVWRALDGITNLFTD